MKFSTTEKLNSRDKRSSVVLSTAAAVVLLAVSLLAFPSATSSASASATANGAPATGTPAATTSASSSGAGSVSAPNGMPMVSPVMAPASKSASRSVSAPASASAAPGAINAAAGGNQHSAQSAAAAGRSPQPASPAASASPASQMSRDGQAAMDVLVAANPSGWNGGPVKIFLPNIDPVAGGSTLDANLAQQTGSSMQDDVQKAASAAPQFLSFNQLTTEVDPLRVEILKEFRCLAVYCKNFKRGQRVINARVYSFDSVDGSYGAYSLLKQGASTVVRRGDGSSEDEQGISFWQGRTFVSVYGTSVDDDESKEVVKVIADRFSGALKEHSGLPQIIEQLPKLDKVKGSEHIVMGTLSARRFSPAPYLNYIDFSHAVAAATADYQVQSPPDRLRLLYVDYRYPAYAVAAYRAYTQNFGGRAIAFEEPVMGETLMYKVNGSFILCQQIDSHLAIISGAKKRQSASLLARFLH
jgi:hypothetical protein